MKEFFKKLYEKYSSWIIALLIVFIIGLVAYFNYKLNEKQKKIDEIETIDKDFAGHIIEIGGVYLGMIYISNNGTPLGFLCVSYHDMKDVPAKDTIERKLKEYDMALAQLLDLQTQINK